MEDCPLSIEQTDWEDICREPSVFSHQRGQPAFVSAGEGIVYISFNCVFMAFSIPRTSIECPIYKEHYERCYKVHTKTADCI